MAGLFGAIAGLCEVVVDFVAPAVGIAGETLAEGEVAAEGVGEAALDGTAEEFAADTAADTMSEGDLAAADGTADELATFQEGDPSLDGEMPPYSSWNDEQLTNWMRDVPSEGTFQPPIESSELPEWMGPAGEEAEALTAEETAAQETAADEATTNAADDGPVIEGLEELGDADRLPGVRRLFPGDGWKEWDPTKGWQPSSVPPGYENYEPVEGEPPLDLLPYQVWGPREGMELEGPAFEGSDFEGYEGSDLEGYRGSDLEGYEVSDLEGYEGSDFEGYEGSRGEFDEADNSPKGVTNLWGGGALPLPVIDNDHGSEDYQPYARGLPSEVTVTPGGSWKTVEDVMGKLAPFHKGFLGYDGVSTGGLMAVLAHVSPGMAHHRKLTKRRSHMRNPVRDGEGVSFHPGIFILNTTTFDAAQISRPHNLTLMHPVHKQVTPEMDSNVAKHLSEPVNRYGFTRGCLAFAVPGLTKPAEGCYIAIDESKASEESRKTFGAAQIAFREARLAQDVEN